MLVQLPQMSIEDMEKVLKYLPEPNNIYVEIHNLKMSAIYDQIQEIGNNIGLDFEGDFVNFEAEINDPTKKKILEIYRFEIERRKEKEN